jgi:UDP-2,3-diacylglucosamine pyrophosphatase LpxH
MITTVREDRLLITSDTHIGSYFCNARSRLIRFLEYASANGYNVCLNGDGIDVLHTSLQRITAETSAFISDVQRVVAKRDFTIYYVVGNHDIILEHYLADWGRIRLVPFLNVLSGGKRIRVEHGHLYDPFFVKHPDMANVMTRVAYYLCRFRPQWYHWYKRYHVFKHRTLHQILGSDVHASLIKGGEGPSFLEAAEELSRRGFDHVVFGHTHNENLLPLQQPARFYINTGSWFNVPHYVEVDHGTVALKPWKT